VHADPPGARTGAATTTTIARAGPGPTLRAAACYLHSLTTLARQPGTTSPRPCKNSFADPGSQVRAPDDVLTTAAGAGLMVMAIPVYRAFEPRFQEKVMIRQPAITDDGRPRTICSVRKTLEPQRLAEEIGWWHLPARLDATGNSRQGGDRGSKRALHARPYDRESVWCCFGRHCCCPWSMQLRTTLSIEDRGACSVGQVRSNTILRAIASRACAVG
jgi:hypothetical protein